MLEIFLVVTYIGVVCCLAAVVLNGKGDAGKKRYNISLAGILLCGITLFATRIFAEQPPASVLIICAATLAASGVGLISTTTPSWRNLAVDDFLALAAPTLLVLSAWTWSAAEKITATAAVDIICWTLLTWMGFMVSRMARLRWSFAKLECVILVTYLTIASVSYALITWSGILQSAALFELGTRFTTGTSILVSIHMVMRARSKYTTPRRDTGRTRPPIWQYLVISLASTAAFLGLAMRTAQFSNVVIVGLTFALLTAIILRTVFSLVSFEQLLARTTRKEKYYRDLVQHSTDLIVIIDPQTTIAQYVSPAAKGLLEFTPDYFMGKPLHEILNCPANELDIDFEGLVLANATHRVETVHAARRLESTFSKHDERILVIVRDVTECNELRQELHRIAHEDGLTKLANRHSILAQMTDLLADNGADTTLLFIDLDKFKPINDAHGHELGDLVLQEVGTRLAATVGDTAFVGRLGGDEFVVLLNSAEADIDQYCAAIQAALRVPMTIADCTYQIGGSIGVAQGEHGMTALELLRRADTAMYAAKRGRAGVAHYQNFLSAVSFSGHEPMVESATGSAERGALTVAYSPIVGLHSDQQFGWEALARWRSEVGTLYDASELVHYSQQAGQAIAMTTWITHQALESLSTRPGSGYMAINISSEDIRDPHYAIRLAELLGEYQVAPDRIVIEVQGEEYLLSAAGEQSFFTRLADLGVNVIVDDFGVGYSMLASMLTEPIAGVKISADFIKALPESPLARSLVTTLVHTAHSRGQHVIAYGVDDLQQHQRVRDLGCDWGQGAHYGTPQLDPIQAQELLGERG